MTVLVAPIIPAINDHEIEAILKASYAAGAREAGYVLLRLPHDLKELMRDWLVEHYPDKLNHVFSLLQEARGGKDYDSGWGVRQTGVGPFAWMLGRRFETTTARLGMNTRRHQAAHGSLRAAGQGQGSIVAVLTNPLERMGPRQWSRTGPHVTNHRFAVPPPPGYRPQARARLEARRLRPASPGLDEVGRGPLAGPGGVGGGGARSRSGCPRDLPIRRPFRPRSAREPVRQDPGHRPCGDRVDLACGRGHDQHPPGLASRPCAGRLAALPCTPDMALVDGNDPPDLPCKVEAIIKGDASIASIAAASIVAKVVRDRLMVRLGAIYPAYGFHTNAGLRHADAPVGARERRPLPVPPNDFFALAPRVTGSVTELNVR